MREKELRAVVLVRSIEEADTAGTLLSPADRVAAAREAKRNVGASLPAQDVSPEGVALRRRAERMLVARADTLLAQLMPRHPFVRRVLARSGGLTWLPAFLLLLSLLLGGALSALDGSRRINILAFPLFGLLLWNLVVYIAIVAGWIRSWRSRTHRRRMPALIGGVSRTLMKRAAARSKSFVAPLAVALERFVDDWYEIAAPLITARAARLFHICAIGVAMGLVTGLYLRGLVLDYQAGWESTFLDAGGVRALLSILYGPASAITGIAVPDIAHLESIRWQGDAGGEPAAAWIHLLAASVALYIVLPRLVLALLGTMAIWRWSIRAPLPPWLTPYFRSVFSGSEAVTRGASVVIPYGYAPSTDALVQLRTLLQEALGPDSVAEVRAQVRYGDEQSFLNSLDVNGAGELFVLLLNLAATPEDENHGIAINGLRQRLARHAAHARFLVMVDEGPYAARMSAHGGAEERMHERRRMWEVFVRKHEAELCFVNLATRAAAAAGVQRAAADDIKRLRAALQSPGRFGH